MANQLKKIRTYPMAKARKKALTATVRKLHNRLSAPLDSMLDEDMATLRDLVNDVSQEFHELNAYRNAYLDQVTLALAKS